MHIYPEIFLPLYVSKTIFLIERNAILAKQSCLELGWSHYNPVQNNQLENGAVGTWMGV